MMDYHLHTRFSPDAKQSIDELCAAARSRGITHLAITDHVDVPDPRYDKPLFIIQDPAAYVEAIDKARRDYPDLSIARGLEIGYVPESWPQALHYLELIRPDFVIGSLHLVDGVDPYEARYFEGITRHEAFRRYLAALLASIPALSEVSHVLGHLTYVSKFAPYENGILTHSDHPELIDEILRAVVKSGLVLEVNTSGYRRWNSPFPELTILRRYRKLGGEFVVLGSDAHEAAYVGAGITQAAALARQAGFTHTLVMEEKRLVPVPLPCP